MAHEKNNGIERILLLYGDKWSREKSFYSYFTLSCNSFYLNLPAFSSCYISLKQQIRGSRLRVDTSHRPVLVRPTVRG